MSETTEECRSRLDNEIKANQIRKDEREKILNEQKEEKKSIQVGIRSVQERIF